MQTNIPRGLSALLDTDRPRVIAVPDGAAVIDDDSGELLLHLIGETSQAAKALRWTDENTDSQHHARPYLNGMMERYGLVSVHCRLHARNPSQRRTWL